MSKFQVGDRIRAYHQHRSDVGTVMEVSADLLHVKFDSDKSGSPVLNPVHPKQCRKLKKKAPKQKVVIENFEVEFLGDFWDLVLDASEEEKIRPLAGKTVRLTMEEK